MIFNKNFLQKKSNPVFILVIYSENKEQGTFLLKTSLLKLYEEGVSFIPPFGNHLQRKKGLLIELYKTYSTT